MHTPSTHARAAALPLAGRPGRPGAAAQRLRLSGRGHRLVRRPSDPRPRGPIPPMKLVFAGTPEVAVPALDALIASGRHQVAAVVTRPDAPAGRGRRLVASPVAERAEEAGIEVLKPERPRDPEFLERLTRIAPDCCPVVAYGALLPRPALDIPAHG